MTKRIRYRLYRSMAGFTLVLAIIPSLTGCIRTYHPKAYVEITKPPIRVVYFDYHKDISSVDINAIMDNMNKTKYHSYKFNDTNKIDVNYNADLTTDHKKTLSAE